MPTLGSSATIIQFAPPHMHHNKTPLDIALDYVARGWNPVPVGFRSKRPSAGEGWQLIRITASNAAQYFNGGEQNIGLQMGPASNNLTDGDIDIEEARAIAPYFMPRTKSKFGRSSARWSHYLYHSNLAEITDDGSIPFKDPTTKPETMILELRIGGGNKGAQTVAPGSVHEDTGEPIVWEEDGPPTRIAGDELLRCTKITAALALLARHWPQRGSKARHYCGSAASSLAAAGTRRKSNLPSKRSPGPPKTKSRGTARPQAVMHSGTLRAAATPPGFQLCAKISANRLQKELPNGSAINPNIATNNRPRQKAAIHNMHRAPSKRRLRCSSNG